MPYVVTRVKPRSGKVDLFDFLDDLIDISAFRPITKFDASNTRTFYYNHITPAKLEELNIPRQIEALERFYELNKDLDINNGNPEYDYEKQVELINQYKHEGISDENELRNVVTEDLEKRGLKFNPNYSTFYIPKASSTPTHKKWRRIDAPSNELSNCLRNLKAIFEVLMDGCYYHTAAFAYIKNRSAKDAVAKHAANKSNWFLKIDFSNFFGSTNHDFSIKMFSEVYPFSEIIKSERGKTALEKCLNLCFLDGGLPQGTPMSPLITNIMMIAIDHEIFNTLRNMTVTSPNGNKDSFVYTRYADDIMVSNRYQFSKTEIINVVESILAKYNAPFSLNKEKTRYGSNAGSNWMLGIMLNQEYKMTVGYKRKKRLKSAINNYMLDRKAGTIWDYEDLAHLQGEISYCMSIEEETIKHILKTYSDKFEDVMSALKEDIKSATSLGVVS